LPIIFLFFFPFLLFLLSYLIIVKYIKKIICWWYKIWVDKIINIGIRNALISPEQEDQQFKCPNCRSPLLPDDLLPDKATREAVDNHLRDWARRRNEQIVPEGNVEDEAGINNNNNNVVVEESTIEMSITSEIPIEKEQQRSTSSDFVVNEQQLSTIKIEDKDKEFNESLDIQADIAEDDSSQTTTTTTQLSKVKTEPVRFIL
jgi:hypothetical protein